MKRPASNIRILLALFFSLLFVPSLHAVELTVTYSYDSLNRLTSAQYDNAGDDTVLSYQYDALGNITEYSTTTGQSDFWAKTFGGFNDDSTYPIQETTDGGFIATGWTSSYGAGDRDGLIIKLDSEGDIQWQKTYGGSDIDVFHHILQTTDGGYVLIGYTMSFGAGERDFLVLKLNSSGIVQWQKAYGGTGAEFSHSIFQTNDSGYIAVGYIKSFGSGGRDGWILKLNSNGDIEWQKAYGGSNNERIVNIKETSDNGYIATGFTESFGSGDRDAWVLKLDSLGNVEWQKTYGGINQDNLGSIIPLSGGGYIVAGGTYSFGAGGRDGWILKLDDNGDILWQKTYGGLNDESLYLVSQTSDGGYIASGYTYSFGAGGMDGLIMKLNPNGDLGNTCDIVNSSNATVTNSTAQVNDAPSTVQTTGASVTNTEVIINDIEVITQSQCLGMTVVSDSDGDGITDDIENASPCLNANDADTDDDGIMDGDEDANQDGVVDTGETNPCNIDTDGDGIQDGTEIGKTSGDVGPDTAPGTFQPDEDSQTTTDPLDSDSDNDGVPDGVEDTNHNGMVDPGETDPSVFSIFITSIEPSFGIEGSEIAINGSNFGVTQGTGYVTFFDNVIATNIISWSDTQIVCTVPASTETGCVTVTTDNGISNCFTFIVVSLPCPGDLDDDGDVDGTDLFIFSDAYSIGDLTADIDNSSVVDVNDLAIFSSIYGRSGEECVPFFTNSLGMTFNLIPSGTFIMGSPPSEPYRTRDETQHQVTLTKSFFMQITEVTQGQWEALMGSNPSYDYGVGIGYPVYNVTWDDVQNFIAILNTMGEGTYRLPTEAEWEYSARAGSTEAYANGPLTLFDHTCGYDSNLDVIGWYCYNSGGQTHPVAQKDSNNWGLYDVHGNVAEMVSDWYGIYPTDPATDPTGPTTGDYRVIRGGGFGNYSDDACRLAFRNNMPESGHGMGFRLVLEP